MAKETKKSPELTQFVPVDEAILNPVQDLTLLDPVASENK